MILQPWQWNKLGSITVCDLGLESFYYVDFLYFLSFTSLVSVTGSYAECEPAFVVIIVLGFLDFSWLKAISRKLKVIV